MALVYPILFSNDISLNIFLFKFLTVYSVDLTSKYDNCPPNLFSFKCLAFLLTELVKCVEKFDKMNINTLPQVLLRCTTHKLLAGVVVPSKRNLQQKQTGRLHKYKNHYMTGCLADSGQKLILISLERRFWKILCSFSGYLKFAEPAGCLHLWIFDDLIMRFCRISYFESTSMVQKEKHNFHYLLYTNIRYMFQFFVFLRKTMLYLRRTYFQVKCDSELLLNFLYNWIWMRLNIELWIFQSKHSS